MTKGDPDVLKAIAKIKNSSQYQILLEMKRNSQITVLARHQYSKTKNGLLSSFKSTEANLKTDFTPTMTEWANEVNWSKFYKDSYDWMAIKLNPHLYKEYEEYRDTVLMYHLSYFTPELHLNGLLEYGINDGKWPHQERKVLFDYISKAFAQISYEPITPKFNEIEPNIESYKEMLDKIPYLKVIRTTATSGAPNWKVQGPKYQLAHYYKNLTWDINNNPIPLTLYFRLHGKKRAPKTLAETMKVRQVQGCSDVVKFQLAPLTYNFQQVKIPFMPYYTSWDEVYPNLVDKYTAYTMIFTTDQSKFDKLHDRRARDVVLSAAYANMPEDYCHLVKIADKNDCQDPRIIVNGMYYVKLGREFNPSGDPIIPIMETAMCYGLHYWMCQPDFGLYQIDDSFNGTDKEIKLADLTKQVLHNFGFIMNPTKTETNAERNYVTFLQVHVGALLNDNDITYFGNIPRRLHRLRYKERTNAFGIIEIIVKDTMHVVDVAISRFVGTISSLGKNIPAEWLDIVYDHFGHLDVWDRIYNSVHSDEWDVTKAEFAFKPQWFLDWIKDKRPFDAKKY